MKIGKGILKNKKANTIMWVLYFFGNKENYYFTTKQLSKLLNKENSFHHNGTQDALLKNMKNEGLIKYNKQQNYGLINNNKDDEEKKGKDTLKPRIISSNKKCDFFIFRLNRNKKTINKTSVIIPCFDWFFKRYDLKYDSEIENYLFETVTKKEDYIQNLNVGFIYNEDTPEKEIHFTKIYHNYFFQDHIIKRIERDYRYDNYGFLIFKEDYNLIKKRVTKYIKNKKIKNIIELKEKINNIIASNINQYKTNKKEVLYQAYNSLAIPLCSEKIKYLYSKIYQKHA